MSRFVEVFGWYGAVAIITAYALVSFSVVTPTTVWYQLLSFTGALGIVAISFYKHTYQPGVLNAVWAGIALLAILSILTGWMLPEWLTQFPIMYTRALGAAIGAIF